MKQLDTPQIITQLPNDLTFDQFIERYKPKEVKHGISILLMYNMPNNKIGLKRIELTKHTFPDHPNRYMFIGYDDNNEQWYYRW